MISIEQKQNEIVETFRLLEDWMDQYTYLVETAQSVAVSEAVRCDANRIRECQSEAWIDIRCNDGKINLAVDSDSLLVKGMLLLLVRILDGEPLATVCSAELDFIETTELYQNVPPARITGLRSAVSKIRGVARQAAVKKNRNGLKK